MELTSSFPFSPAAAGCVEGAGSRSANVDLHGHDNTSMPIWIQRPFGQIRLPVWLSLGGL